MLAPPRVRGCRLVQSIFKHPPSTKTRQVGRWCRTRHRNGCLSCTRRKKSFRKPWFGARKMRVSRKASSSEEFFATVCCHVASTGFQPGTRPLPQRKIRLFLPAVKKEGEGRRSQKKAYCSAFFARLLTIKKKGGGQGTDYAPKQNSARTYLLPPCIVGETRHGTAPRSRLFCVISSSGSASLPL